MRILLRYVDALAHRREPRRRSRRSSGSAPSPPTTPRRCAGWVRSPSTTAIPKAAREIHVTLIDKFGEKFVGTERAEISYRLGESARKLQDYERAEIALEEAADLDPNHARALDALAKLHEAREAWGEVVAAKKRLLDLATTDDDRLRLVVECGDILAQKLKDRNGAAKQYVAALDERPDDRAVMLTKLMQLYSEGEDWSKRVEVVLRLGDLTTDPKAKGKYLMTAAIVTDRQLKHPTDAADLYERVVDADPSNDKALEEAIRLRKEQGDHAANERLLRTRHTRAKAAGDKVGQLAALDALGDLYHRHLGRGRRGHRGLRGWSGARPGEPRSQRDPREHLRVRSLAVPRQGGQGADGDPQEEPLPRRVVQAAPQALHAGQARRRGLVHVPGAREPQPRRGRRGALLQAPPHRDRRRPPRTA